MSIQKQIAELIKDVHTTVSAERAAICGYDCMMQWELWGESMLKDTIHAWKRYIWEVKHNESHTDCNRNGVWVPAIPL